MENRYWFQAKGLDYQDYACRPTYRAQCVTAKFANSIFAESGGVTHSGIPDELTQYRMLRPYRSEAANELRTQVAHRVRAERRRIRKFSKTMRNLPVQCHPCAYVLAHQEASKALARGEIRSFSVTTCPERGRVIHYETDQGWNPDPAFCDVYPEEECDPHSSYAW